MRLLAGIFLMIPCCLYAAEIYKSVDEQGNITYSEEPPVSGDVEIIKTQPGPDADQVKAAKEREQKLEKTLDAMDTEDRKSERVPQPTESGNPEVVNEGGVVVGGPGIRRGEHASGANTAPGAGTAHGAPTAGDLDHARRRGRPR
jgi:hypothetical protein